MAVVTIGDLGFNMSAVRFSTLAQLTEATKTRLVGLSTNLDVSIYEGQFAYSGGYLIGGYITGYQQFRGPGTFEFGVSDMYVNYDTYMYYSNINNIQGIFRAALVGNDEMNGGAGSDLLFAHSGDDLLRGRVGNDTLYGESGNDLIYGNHFEDFLSGESGNDTLFGGQGFDIVYGGADGDAVYGNFHNDTVYGDAGNDALYGGQDDDWVRGGDGDDQLFGNLGNDTLAGGNGVDWLHGGQGADIFFVERFGLGKDYVMDFEPGVDKVRFEYFSAISGVTATTILDQAVDTAEGMSLPLSSISSERIILFGIAKSSISIGDIIVG